MNKSPKASDGPGSFERFEKIAKGLIAVPRRELQEKLDKYRREKQKARKKRA